MTHMVSPHPDSFGSLREANPCHTPAGSPAGGRFCDGTGVTHPGPVEGQTYYLRFGAPPASGRSTNFALGTIEAGVAVYAAVGRDGKFEIEVPQDGEWAHEDLLNRLKQDDDTVYVVSGDHVGIGHDGEPLLARVTNLGRVPRTMLRAGHP